MSQQFDVIRLSIFRESWIKLVFSREYYLIRPFAQLSHNQTHSFHLIHLKDHRFNANRCDQHSVELIKNPLSDTSIWLNRSKVLPKASILRCSVSHSDGSPQDSWAHTQFARSISFFWTNIKAWAKDQVSIVLSGGKGEKQAKSEVLMGVLYWMVGNSSKSQVIIILVANLMVP